MPLIDKSVISKPALSLTVGGTRRTVATVCSQAESEPSSGNAQPDLLDFLSCRAILEYIDEVVFVTAVSPSHPVEAPVRFVSPNVERVLGYTPQDFIDDATLWFRRLHAEDAPAVLESMRRVAAQRTPATLLYRARRRASTEYIWLEDKVVPRPDASGALVALVRVARDVTSELLTRDALADSEARFRHLVESSPDAVLVIAADGRITTINREAERMFGYERAALVGQSVEILVPETSRAHHTEMRRAFGINPRQRPMGAGLDLVARRRDGTHVRVEIALSPMVGDRGVLTIATVREADRPVRLEPVAARVADDAAGTATILIVEEDDAVRELMATVLERERFRVLKARHAADAIVVSRVHVGAIHLLLTSVLMPRAGGSVLAEYLRRDRPGLKALYTYAPTAETATILDRLDPGAAILEKPFTPLKLTEKVRELLADVIGPATA